ncbi:hypothetical protein G9F71_021095 [Clostridium sp. FP2]|uniref:hypothetical protein n=1 Tax=Clostridium sp. FP2 TaxID=2724481 RepID=UPI0013E9613D|nr:hypothetical protein [Clostridium sp. FP2]MBZ9625326.1 hypothetical protein [Clostridium sp. FP2]
MIIYYPAYYLVPVIPVISLDGYEYRHGNSQEYHSGFRFNMDQNEVHNTYRNIDEDIFGEIDEEYVNESTK